MSSFAYKLALCVLDKRQVCSASHQWREGDASPKEEVRVTSFVQALIMKARISLDDGACLRAGWHVVFDWKESEVDGEK